MGHGKPQLSLGIVQKCFYLPEAGWKGQNKTMRLTGFTHKCPSGCPTLSWANTPAQLEFLVAAPLWSNSCHDKGESSLWDVKGSSKPEQEESNHYWNLHRQHITRRPHVWEWPDHHTQYTDFCQINTPTLLLQHCSPLGLQELETHYTPKRTVMVTEQRGRSTGSHLALAPAPSVLTHPLTRW